MPILEQNKGLSIEPLALAVETSGRVGSVAIGFGTYLSEEKPFSGNMRHSVELFDTVIELLKKIKKKPPQIEQIYISAGPGSFTGVRIAVTLAKTMALANNLKIVAVNTMDALAENVPVNTNNTDFARIKRIAVIIDAKRGQFFTAVFEKQKDHWQKIGSDFLTRPSEFIHDYGNKPIWLLGEGLLYYADKFRTENIKILDQKYWPATAANIYKLGSKSAEQGKFTDAETLTPLYLRRTEAEENWEKKNEL